MEIGKTSLRRREHAKVDLLRRFLGEKRRCRSGREENVRLLGRCRQVKVKAFGGLGEERVNRLSRFGKRYLGCVLKQIAQKWRIRRRQVEKLRVGRGEIVQQGLCRELAESAEVRHRRCPHIVEEEVCFGSLLGKEKFIKIFRGGFHQEIGKRCRLKWTKVFSWFRNVWSGFAGNSCPIINRKITNLK